MPCWYFEKKEIKNSPSYRDGIDSLTECRYRREGARFIVDAGTKLGLRYDTCATGVVYFHRFYMFHSFKEFPRYVTASCCLFLAGKVEETPKKCKDIIKISQSILNPKQFATFGNDPKEEVMTVERVLLQTIKFDLQTEHPYAFLLKFAKMIKADKQKIQKLVQMAWTFINDSLCTSLCLQWEPEIIAVSLMYLGTRLNKFEVTDWSGKISGSKQKWWECLVEDLTVDLMEDICHQVLDLYSPSNQPSATDSGESPPPPPPIQNASRTPSSQGSSRKRSLHSTPSDPVTPSGQSTKSMKLDPSSLPKKLTPQKNVDRSREPSATRQSGQPQQQQQQQQQPQQQQQQPQQPTSESAPTHSQAPTPTAAPSGDVYGTNPPRPPDLTPSSQYPSGTTTDFSQYNPYVSASQYQASFLSQEGAQSLHTMMGTSQPQTFTANQTLPNYSQPPPPVTVPPPSAPQYGLTPGHYPPGYNPGQYPTSAVPPGPPVQSYPTQSQQFQGTTYGQYPPQYPPGNYQHPPPPAQPPQQQTYDQQGAAYQGSVGGTYNTSGQAAPRPRTNNNNSHRNQQPRPSSSITTVRITGR